MPEADHKLFVVKSNDGIALRLSTIPKPLAVKEYIEVMIYGLPAESSEDERR